MTEFKHRLDAENITLVLLKYQPTNRKSGAKWTQCTKSATVQLLHIKLDADVNANMPVKGCLLVETGHVSEHCVKHYMPVSPQLGIGTLCIALLRMVSGHSCMHDLAL